MSSKKTVRVLFAFGLNEDGQCGRSVKKDSAEFFYPSPVKFPDLTIRIMSVSAGSRHSLVLSDSGHVYSFGWGRVGQLGLGDFHSICHPARLNLEEIVSISAGGMHSACINNKNMCYTWGSNSDGQLGLGKRYRDGPESAVYHPTLVNFEDQSDEAIHGNMLVKKVSCGGMHTAFIGLNGELFCCGKADSGQLGISTWYLDFESSLSYPKRVPGLPAPAIDIACGGFFTLVLTAQHVVYAMGKEDFGCLGTGIELSNMSIGMETPTLIQSSIGKTVKAVSTGGWHSCFLLDNGVVEVCGKGEYGRLGLGSERSMLEPTQITNTLNSMPFSPVQKVGPGGSHTLFLSSSNSIFSVGRLDGGRCGNGPHRDADRMVLPQDISNNFYSSSERRFVDVAAGGAHSLVLAEFVVEEDGAENSGSIASTVIAQVQAYQRELMITRR